MKLRKKRINNLIKTLETEAGKNMFDMEDWIGHNGSKSPRRAFASGGTCGTTACIAGMSAIIDPDFFIIEKLPLSDYTPKRHYCIREKGADKTEDVIKAFSHWLNIPYEDAWSICYNDTIVWNHKNDWESEIEFATKILKAYRDGGMKELNNVL